MPDAHFTRRYAAAADPWDLEGSWYEERKHRLTVAALPRRRYTRAFEPGCSIGLLTSLLATRCDTLLAMDVADEAVAAAGRRCAAQPHVRSVQGGVPEDWPAGTFDLVVLSEIAYYLDGPTLTRTLDLAAETLEPEGHLVAVHYRPAAEEHLQDGDAVHERLRAHPGFTAVARYREEAFRLDVVRGRR